MELYELSRTQIEWLIHEYIHDRRDRDICHLRFIDGLTYEKLAEEVGMSARQVRRIIFRCKQVFAERMNDVPLRSVM